MVGVITFVAATITSILFWMMNYQSDVVNSPSPSSSSQWLQSYHFNQPSSDTTENFTLENMVNETIDQPENITIAQAEETTEPFSAIPVVPEPPKIPWSQFNQSLLELEQEQSAIMTLLTQKYSYVLEPETKIVEPSAKVMAPQPQIVEPQPDLPKMVATDTKTIATTARAVEPETNRLTTTTVETEPETPQTIAAETKIIATTARPIEPETNTLMTATQPIELTDLLGKKPSLQPRELTWDTDWFIQLNSNTWLNIGQQILELEQWREKTINSLNTKFNHHGNNEDEQ